jgi:hypothetical protein
VPLPSISNFKHELVEILKKRKILKDFERKTQLFITCS